jgi:hypothetical protein
MTTVSAILPLIAACALATGCVVTPLNRYQALDSTARMQPNAANDKNHQPYVYAAPDTDWSRYTAATIDLVVIYRGNDQQFGQVSQAERQTLAAYMQQRFAKALQTKYVLATTSMPNELRVHATLTGAKTDVPVLSTVAKVVPVGAVIHTVESAADKPDAFSGSVSYAIEIYDASSGRLLRAYESRQYPAAENVVAGFGALGAAKTGIDKGATALLAQLK